ncbi:ATPase, T2SS/T4P/T4SS family, partial [Eubacterium sp. CAG:156]|uniref:ATPase, T2SS/T4P/T4SS family n=1 Tax=Eubacterium sp. CAG:156 TaxID=1262880 RepID=UPI003267BA21
IHFFILRADRIIVGEVRGAEAVDMLQAMNTGHDGSMCTGHANSAQDMMYRLENMVLTGIDIPLEAIKSQIGAAIDIVVHLGRLRDKTRKVMTIHEMVKDENEKIKLQPLYVYKETGESNGIVQGSLEKTEKKLKNNEKLAAHGIEI